MTDRINDGAPTESPDAANLLWIVAAAAALSLFAVTIPAAVVAIHDKALPHGSIADLLVGSLKIVHEGHWRDPASAFPPELRAHMPPALGWWFTAAITALTLAAALIVLWRRVDTATARHRIGRRSYDLRGARPRDWARPRDLAPLVVRRARPGRFTLGRLDRRLLASEPESHVAVVAPTRSGKTTRFVIPWLLEHDGPAIVTSTKPDVVRATREHRERYGKVFLWDPFGPESCTWNPLAGCADWRYALRQARWLADSAEDGDSQIARYWRGEAAKLLAPLIHAAACADLGISVVREWIDMQDTQRPLEHLKEADALPAAQQLAAVAALDDRNRGTTYMSAGSLLAAYRHPDASRTTRDGLTPQQLLSGANTLYIVSPEHDQRLLAPLVVALVSSMLHAAVERRNGPLNPTLRVLLDEAANIAPLADLPGTSHRPPRMACVSPPFGSRWDRCDIATAMRATRSLRTARPGSSWVRSETERRGRTWASCSGASATTGRRRAADDRRPAPSGSNSSGETARC